MPITLDIDATEIKTLDIKTGSRLSLRDPRDDSPLAILTGMILLIPRRLILMHIRLVESIFTPDKKHEAEKVFGADDIAHPSVAYLHNKVKDTYIGGKVQAIQVPAYFDYVELRFTPAELRAHFKKLAWRRVVAFQVRSIFML
jgi:sulfate adenylyltransferase